MRTQANNAPIFVDIYWACIELAEKRGLKTPGADLINEMMANHEIPYFIDLPNRQLVSHSTTEIRDSHKDNTTQNFAYKKIELIGQGGYGSVFRASRITSVGEFFFALKILEPSAFVENTEKAQARFSREVRAISGLQHRAIVQYCDAGVTPDNKPYIAMQLIDGLKLRDAVESRNSLEKIRIFIEILNALGNV